MSMPSKRCTIHDVAADAEVSISTVSLVMNGKNNVSPATRARVQEAAERLGYVPRKAARQLASQKTGNVGLILLESHFTRSEPFYTRIFLGTEFEARHQQRYVLLATVPASYEPGVHTPRFLKEHNVDGVLVAGKTPTALLDELERDDLPTVLIDYERDPFASVCIDNRGGTRAATSYLTERGHRHIAFLGADIEHPSLAERLDGYRLALAEAGLPFDETLILLDAEHGPRRATGRRLASSLLALEPRPTAAFCVNDAIALGLLDAVREAGLSVPDDLAIVGFDDVDGAATSVPPLTTVRVFKEQLGELALRHLGDLIDQATRPSASATPEPPYTRGGSSLRIATELVVRHST